MCKIRQKVIKIYVYTYEIISATQNASATVLIYTVSVQFKVSVQMYLLSARSKLLCSPFHSPLTNNK